MKYLFVFLAALAIANVANAQQTKEAKAAYSDIPPYQRDSTMPHFTLLYKDSTWLVTTTLPVRNPTVFIFFSPECPHCQHEADSLAKYMGQMKKITFIFTTYTPTFGEIDSFAVEHHLAGLKNVHFTKDPNYQLGSFYRITMYPFVALYKRGMLVKTWSGHVSPQEIMEMAK